MVLGKMIFNYIEIITNCFNKIESCFLNFNQSQKLIIINLLNSSKKINEIVNDINRSYKTTWFNIESLIKNNVLEKQKKENKQGKPCYISLNKKFIKKNYKVLECFFIIKQLMDIKDFNNIFSNKSKGKYSKWLKESLIIC